jgi:hypothetical protein
MSEELLDLNLPVGWTCWLELTSSADGAFSGKAELRHDRETRCVFLLAQKSSRAEVLKRLQLRADEFFDEWQARISGDSNQSTVGSDGRRRKLIA